MSKTAPKPAGQSWRDELAGRILPSLVQGMDMQNMWGGIGQNLGVQPQDIAAKVAYEYADALIRLKNDPSAEPRPMIETAPATIIKSI